MSTLRKETRTGYTHIDNNLCEAEGLSFRARGIALVLLSKPDNWEIRIAWLMKIGKEGEKAIRTALHELAEHGFLMRERVRGENGVHTVTHIADYPAFINIGTTEERINGYQQRENSIPDIPVSDMSQSSSSQSRQVTNGEVLVTTDLPITDLLTTNTNTTDKKSKKATPSHPMTNPIKDAYVKAVGHKLPPSAFVKIAPDAKFAAEQGVIPEQVEKTYAIMKLDEYWKDKTIPLRVVLEKIANTNLAIRNRQEESNGQVGENPKWTETEMARIRQLKIDGRKEEASAAVIALQRRVREMQRNGVAL